MQDLLPVLMLAIAGFLLGGVYALWKTARVFAIVLAAAAAIATAGGILWML